MLAWWRAKTSTAIANDSLTTPPSASAKANSGARAKAASPASDDTRASFATTSQVAQHRPLPARRRRAGRQARWPPPCRPESRAKQETGAPGSRRRPPTMPPAGRRARPPAAPPRRPSRRRAGRSRRRAPFGRCEARWSHRCSRTRWRGYRPVPPCGSAEGRTEWSRAHSRAGQRGKAAPYQAPSHADLRTRGGNAVCHSCPRVSDRFGLWKGSAATTVAQRRRIRRTSSRSNSARSPEK